MRKLAPLTESQQATLQFELEWLRSTVPAKWGARAQAMAMEHLYRPIQPHPTAAPQPGHGIGTHFVRWDREALARTGRTPGNMGK
jgi:hypothetical protein